MQAYIKSYIARFCCVVKGRGVCLYLPMAQLSHDQFWGLLFKNENFENNLRVKHFSLQMSLYSTKISFGDRVGAKWGRPPGSPIELPWLGELRLCC